MTGIKEVSTKIISTLLSTLLIAAILFLFNSINGLNQSVSDLSQQIAVMQERSDMRAQNWERDRTVIDKTVAIVNSLSKRVDKLEWNAKNQQGSRTQ